jgi:hypothetical protein
MKIMDHDNNVKTAFSRLYRGYKPNEEEEKG